MTDEQSHPELDALELGVALQDLAAATRAFYLELRRRGFSRRQSLALTRAWLDRMLANGAKP